MKTKKQPPWTVERRVGHLVEIRVNRLDSVDNVKEFSDAIVKIGAATQDAVIVVDLRTPLVFSPPVASAVVTLMTRTNRVRRKTAIFLAGAHAVFAMQLGRLVRQVGDPQRETFTDTQKMLSWLGDVLSDPEKARLKEFIGAHPGLSDTS